MTKKERLTATLRGETVDRPAVNFYELNGLEENPQDDNPFNIFTDPSWQSLLELTRTKTDRIVMHTGGFTYDDPAEERTEVKETMLDNGYLRTEITIHADNRDLKQTSLRHTDVNTSWVTEHFIKDEDDFKAWLKLPSPKITGFCPDEYLKIEEQLGDSGILMVDTADAICRIAGRLSMEDYTVFALTEQKLMHAAMEKLSETLLEEAKIISDALPGRLWRICGPEYATPPYLPPNLYKEYVTDYDKPLVDIIHKNGGFARIHQHGNSKDILDYTLMTGCAAIDPIEPPPQGDVSLSYVREKYGDKWVLFGNLEINDIEMLPPDEFEKRVYRALEEGTRGNGRGFVLMPSASPYGRKLSDTALLNYHKIIEVMEKLYGVI